MRARADNVEYGQRVARVDRAARTNRRDQLLQHFGESSFEYDITEAALRPRREPLIRFTKRVRSQVNVVSSRWR